MARLTLPHPLSAQRVSSHPHSPRVGIGEMIGLFAPIIVLLLLMLVFTILNPRFLSPLNLINILRQSSVLMVVALGATFIIIMGSIDLSMSSIVTLCGLVGAMFIRDHGEWAVLLVLLIGILCGLLNGILFAYAKLPSFLVTLGTLFAFNGLALFFSNGQPVEVNAGLLSNVFTGDSFGFFPNIVLWAAAILVLSGFVASRTKFGRLMYAIGGGEKVARLSGVPVERYKVYAFLVSGLLAAFGGMLLMFRIAAGTPDMGSSFLLDSIAAVVMGGTALTGGIGGPYRTLVGVLVITILSNGMNIANIHPYLQIFIRGVVVIAAVALTIDRSKIALVK